MPKIIFLVYGVIMVLVYTISLIVSYWETIRKKISKGRRKGKMG